MRTRKITLDLPVGLLDRAKDMAERDGLPLNEGRIVLERKPVKVPETLPAGESRVVPFRAGETLPWRLV